MSLQKYRTPRPVWLGAFLAAMAVHAATLAGLDWTRMLAPAPLEAVPPSPIEMVFSPPEPEVEKDPSFFTELPPDRADLAPEKPDFLSNVDSRARDRVEGGAETALPNLQGDSEAPHVQLESGEPATPSPPGEPTPKPPTEAREEPPDEGITRVEPLEEKPEVADPPRTVLETLLRRRPGSFDMDQEAMRNPFGDASLPGDISMNTTAWAWAPWLQRFRRDFLQIWYAPPAYYMGLIEGWNLVQLRISPEGELLELTVLDEEGHPSLVQSSVQAFRAQAPYQPLPEDFPEKELVLKVKLLYQQRKPR